MPPVVAFAGGFITALTGGVIAFGAPTAAFALGVAAATGIGGTLVVGALLVGANAIVSALSNRSTGVNSPEARGSIKQATPSQRIIYGYARVGGALFFLDDTLSPDLYLGLLIAARRVTAIDQYNVGITPVATDLAGNVLTSPWNTSTPPTRLKLSFRNGDPNQLIDPLLAAAFPSLPSTFRQRGSATVTMRASYGVDIDDFQAMWGNTQLPNLLFDVRGATVYDPRIAGADPDDETTWGFSNTAALVQADWLRQPYGGRLPTSKLRWDEIARSADYDDELVGLRGGGFQKRYTIDGMIQLNQDPFQVMQSMLSANRGFVVSNQGRVWVTSSPPETPVMTITDSMLRGGFEYRATNPKAQLVNKMRIRFVAPDREYNTVDGPVLDRPDLLALDGELLEATLGLPFTLGDARAQRLAKLYLDSARLQRGLTCSLPLRRSLGLRAGRAVTVESEIYPMINGTYMVGAIGFTDDFGLRPVTLIEYDASLAGQWAPDTDQLPFVLADLDA